MDALEFLMERKRLCSSYKCCVGCPFGAADCVVRDMTPEDNCERIVTAVEQWSKEHPRKTRQSVFLKQYPEAEIDANGVVRCCPMPISAAHRYSNGGCRNPEKLCMDCRREFWMQEVE